MGLSASSEGARPDRIISQKLREEREREYKNVKILLLGTGESGKSTITKSNSIDGRSESKFARQFSKQALSVRRRCLVLRKLLTCKRYFEGSGSTIDDLSCVYVLSFFENFRALLNRSAGKEPKFCSTSYTAA